MKTLRRAALWGVVGIAAGFWLDPAGAGEAPRRWTATTGNSIQALLVETNGEKVVLQTASGERVTFLRAQFIKTDQQYLDEWARRLAAAAEASRPLQFKDFRLRMPREEVAQLVGDMKWEYELTSLPDGNQVFLKAYVKADENVRQVASHGSQGPAWSRVCLSFRTNVVQEISVYGPEYATGSLETEIMTWLDPVAEVLKAELGRPDSVPDKGQLKFQVLGGLRRMGIYPILHWKRTDGQDVQLRAIRIKGEDKFCGQIVYRVVDPPKAPRKSVGPASK